MLEKISATYEDNGYDKAISNALAGTSISVLALNADNAAMIASQGYYDYKADKIEGTDLNASAN